MPNWDPAQGFFEWRCQWLYKKIHIKLWEYQHWHCVDLDKRYPRLGAICLGGDDPKSVDLDKWQKVFIKRASNTMMKNINWQVFFYYLWVLECTKDCLGCWSKAFCQLWTINGARSLWGYLDSCWNTFQMIMQLLNPDIVGDELWRVVHSDRIKCCEGQIGD